MQQTLKEIVITIAHLQQGNEAKPMVATSNRNSKIPGILNWETHFAPKRVDLRVLGKVKVKIKALMLLSYVGGAQGKCQMTRHNIGYKIVTSSRSVKRNIGKNR